MSENIMLIPSRLKSSVPGGHVVGTDQVFDDTIGKTQAEINASLGDVTEGLDQKIDTKVGTAVAGVKEEMQQTINEAVTAAEGMVDAAVETAQGQIHEAVQTAQNAASAASQAATNAQEQIGSAIQGMNDEVAAAKAEVESAVEEAKAEILPPEKILYYGAGVAYTDATGTATVKETLRGRYDINIATDGSYIWICTPTSIPFVDATMGGVSLPVVQQGSVAIDNDEYNVYKSSNTYDAGDVTIVLV
jgi:uncharacterized protein (DUF2342 family)